MFASRWERGSGSVGNPPSEANINLYLWPLGRLEMNNVMLGHQVKRGQIWGFGVGYRLRASKQVQRFSDSILCPCWRFQRISVGSICKDRPPWMVPDHFVELLAFFGPKRDFPSQLTLHRLGPANFCERKDVVAKYVRLKSCEQTLWRGEGFHRSRYKILSLDSLNWQIRFWCQGFNALQTGCVFATKSKTFLIFKHIIVMTLFWKLILM